MHCRSKCSRTPHYNKFLLAPYTNRILDLSTQNEENATGLMCRHLLPQKVCEMMSERFEFDKSIQASNLL